MKWQIYGVWVSMLISLAGLSLIVWTVEPQAASFLVKSLFFIALFILIWSVATAIIFSVKNRRIRPRIPNGSTYDSVFYDSFFAGLFMSVILTAALLIRRII